MGFVDTGCIWSQDICWYILHASTTCSLYFLKEWAKLAKPHEPWARQHHAFPCYSTPCFLHQYFKMQLSKTQTVLFSVRVGIHVGWFKLIDGLLQIGWSKEPLGFGYGGVSSIPNSCVVKQHGLETVSATEGTINITQISRMSPSKFWEWQCAHQVYQVLCPKSFDVGYFFHVESRSGSSSSLWIRGDQTCLLESYGILPTQIHHVGVRRRTSFSTFSPWSGSKIKTNLVSTFYWSDPHPDPISVS